MDLRVVRRNAQSKDRSAMVVTMPARHVCAMVDVLDASCGRIAEGEANDITCLDPDRSADSRDGEQNRHIVHSLGLFMILSRAPPVDIVIKSTAVC